MPNLKRRETWYALTDDQNEFSRELARRRGPGKYTLKEIYGDQWQFVLRKQRFGFLFKRAVLAGALPGICLAGRRSNKSMFYEVTL